MQLNSAQEDIIQLDDKGAVVGTQQHLGSDYWNDLQAAKDDFAFRLNGLTPVASIPESVVNRMIREGFDFWNAPAKDIIKKLRSMEMDGMIVSGDKTF